MSDPVEIAKQQERDERLPFIYPEKFWNEYKSLDDGTLKTIEMVKWVKKGTTNPVSGNEKIARLIKEKDPKWSVIEPFYKKWKEGEEIPTNGVPLAAWPGADEHFVTALKSVNIRSVEDFAEMEDSSLSRMNIPGLRGKQQVARSWLEARTNSAGVSAEVTKLREDNKFLRDELEELKRMIMADAPESNAAPVIAPVEQPAKRKPGRPRKIQAAA